MAQLIGRLTALHVQRTREPGMYADGAGLYLQVSGDGRSKTAKSWIYRFTLRGRTREMGLGPVATFGLAEARARVTECRKLVYDGIDPIEARKAAKARNALERAKSVTFKDCAEKYIGAHKAGWRNEKHAAQWTATLTTYADPVFAKISVQDIDTALVMKVVEPIWSSKSETAGRVRGRIEAILDWATVHGFRIGDNPARWRGHLDKLLPSRSKVHKVKHHAALPFDELPAFMSALRKQDGVAARALEFLILTVARTGEVIGARLDEIYDDVWTIPAVRMKAGNVHRVPPSPDIAPIPRTRSHRRTTVVTRRIRRARLPPHRS